MTNDHLSESEPLPDGLHQSVYTPAQLPATSNSHVPYPSYTIFGFAIFGEQMNRLLNELNNTSLTFRGYPNELNRVR